MFESLGLQLYEKETSMQVFFCKIYKISKNTFFYRKATVAASEVELLFSKESWTKTYLIISNTY